jgi:hypothetical protein
MGVHDDRGARLDAATFGGEDETVSDAKTSLGRTVEERSRMFLGVQSLVAATWAGLSEEEMLRRLRISDELEPRPEPWWRDVRREALP